MFVDAPTQWIANCSTRAPLSPFAVSMGILSQNPSQPRAPGSHQLVSGDKKEILFDITGPNLSQEPISIPYMVMAPDIRDKRSKERILGNF